MPKMEYFGDKFQKSPSAGGSGPRFPCFWRLGVYR